MIWSTFNIIQKYESQLSKCCTTEVFQGKGISLIQKYFGGWRHSKHSISCLCQWNVGTTREQCPRLESFRGPGKFWVINTKQWRRSPLAPNQVSLFTSWTVNSEWTLGPWTVDPKIWHQIIIAVFFKCTVLFWSHTHTRVCVHTHTHWIRRRGWASSNYYI